MLLPLIHSTSVNGGAHTSTSNTNTSPFSSSAKQQQQQIISAKSHPVTSNTTNSATNATSGTINSSQTRPTTAIAGSLSICELGDGNKVSCLNASHDSHDDDPALISPNH